MITSVPQFIDIEDKVAGPFTWRQLGWMFGMGAALFLLYSMLSRGVFFIAAIPVIISFFALAFYRPNGMPLAKFVFYAVGFLFRPKIVVWERPTLQRSAPKTVETKPAEKATQRKNITMEEIERLAKSVDQGARGGK